jgi:hypothetical protein
MEVVERFAQPVRRCIFGHGKSLCCSSVLVERTKKFYLTVLVRSRDTISSVAVSQFASGTDECLAAVDYGARSSISGISHMHQVRVSDRRSRRSPKERSVQFPMCR